jgi:DNA invertase Pin-like site-specific DNA recombinase
MRVAIYARVSTDDRGQDPENQLRELRDWVVNSGHLISREYVDNDSGRKGASEEGGPFPFSTQGSKPSLG